MLGWLVSRELAWNKASICYAFYLLQRYLLHTVLSFRLQAGRREQAVERFSVGFVTLKNLSRSARELYSADMEHCRLLQIRNVQVLSRLSDFLITERLALSVVRCNVNNAVSKMARGRSRPNAFVAKKIVFVFRINLIWTNFIYVFGTSDARKDLVTSEYLNKIQQCRRFQIKRNYGIMTSAITTVRL